MLEIKQIGGLTKIDSFLTNLRKNHFKKRLGEYGELGVDALKAATPVRTGKTALSWGYEIKDSGDKTTITWVNTNVSDGVNVAYILDHGHGTGTGGYVPGKHFIEPAMDPVMDKIADENWKEVTSS